LPTDPSVWRHTHPEVNDRPESRRHGRRTSFAAIGAVALVTALALSYAYSFGHRTITPRSINSIAVRPFANESGDPNLEYLCTGLADTLIDSLSKVPGLEVKKGATSDARKAGQELNVVAVLSGYLIKTGEDLTLRVELDSRKGA